MLHRIDFSTKGGHYKKNILGRRNIDIHRQELRELNSGTGAQHE
jgi:hypothetical protein